MKHTPQLLFLILFIFGCSSSDRYEPEGLRKLSSEEILERVKAKCPLNENVQFKDTLGNIIPMEVLSTLDQNEFFFDQYANQFDDVLEIVVKKASIDDKKLMQQLKTILERSDSVTVISVNCAAIQEILDHVYRTDQESRQQGRLDVHQDEKNQQVVVSIIEQCGFPTLEEHGYTSVQAVFLVIQHAGKKLRQKYFPLIKQSADRGDISWATVALMEDRILMDNGQKQKYGSQLTRVNGSAQWVVHPIEDPENVNTRRAAVGLVSIEEYLKSFGIKYTAE